MKGRKNFKYGAAHDMVDFQVAVLGAAAAAPTVPADGRFLPATSTFPKRLNGVSQLAAEAPTRTSAGKYVITFSADFSLVNMWADGSVLSAGAAPTAALAVTVLIVDPVARQITVLVTVPTTGAATDAGTSDLILLNVTGQDSNA